MVATDRSNQSQAGEHHGVPILEVAHEAGFFDQAHLSRSLKRLIGQTPAQILRREEQLSFLYKTTPSR